MNGLPDVCFPSPFNDSGLFWQKEWGKESITVNKCYCLEGWSSWYGWSCLCGPLQYYATWWRPSGLCIYLTCSLLPHIGKKLLWSYGSTKIFTFQCSLMDVLFCLVGLVNTWPVVDSYYPYNHKSLVFRLDPMQEECSLFTLNAWRQTTLQAGLSGSMQ
jgi:hypothetical protein